MEEAILDVSIDLPLGSQTETLQGGFESQLHSTLASIGLQLGDAT